ncbi:hypothetical protein ACQR18_30180 [Bradyrhizobium oligotrophicum]|uniref:hypothetical protein n=1 Tax=Bradyrhizobium oligotrophicum TaxID=44255 RepID=UPI003EBF8E65
MIMISDKTQDVFIFRKRWVFRLSGRLSGGAGSVASGPLGILRPMKKSLSRFEGGVSLK